MGLSHAPHTIKVKKYSDNVEELVVTTAGLLPGMLVELLSTGYIQAHSVASGDVCPPKFVLEDELQGKSIDETYSALDRAQVWIPARGDWVYAILADGQNVAIGDKLASNGDGTLKKHVTEVESWEVSQGGSVTVYPNQIVAVAREAVDLSGSSGEESSGPLGFNKRVIVEIV